MLVGNLASTNYLSPANLAKLRESKADNDNQSAKRKGFGHDDAYIPSKAKNLDEVKSRVATGFYNTVEVNDDLTEFFSNIFKKTLPQNL